jgi:hypothetical protein
VSSRLYTVLGGYLADYLARNSGMDKYVLAGNPPCLRSCNHPARDDRLSAISPRGNILGTCCFNGHTLTMSCFRVGLPAVPFPDKITRLIGHSTSFSAVLKDSTSTLPEPARLLLLDRTQRALRYGVLGPARKSPCIGYCQGLRDAHVVRSFCEAWTRLPSTALTRSGR